MTKMFGCCHGPLILHISNQQKTSKHEARKYSARAETEAEQVHKQAKKQAEQNAHAIPLGIHREDKAKSVSIKSLVRSFDPEKSKVFLFLAAFEKQAKNEDLVAQLLLLLTILFAKTIKRQPIR